MLNHIDNAIRINLCMDESGVATVGIIKQRFFLQTAVVISPDQQSLASLLFEKWRNKYLSKPEKSFHAADFFENFEEEYKKNELNIPRNFEKAIKDLEDILSHVDFEARVYYVDLFKLQKLLGIKNAPKYKDKFSSEQEKKLYHIEKRKFQKYFHDNHPVVKDYPYIFPLVESFKFHSLILSREEKNDPFGRAVKGSISFESLSGADTKPVATFHKFKDKIFDDYKDRIISINFPTKSSLDGGIEIADLISYVSCQTLRSSHKLKNELKNIPEFTLKKIAAMRKIMRGKYSIELIDLTDYKLP